MINQTFQEDHFIPYTGRIIPLNNGKIFIGPHCKSFQSGPCFAIGFILVFVLITTFCLVIVLKLPIPLNVMGLLLSLQPLIAYFITGVIDPGIATINYNEQKNAIKNGATKYCKKCKICIKKYTNHCSDCDVCIQDYDHHCPWIGKCVGRKNICYFYYFIISLFMFIIGASVLATTHG